MKKIGWGSFFESYLKIIVAVMTIILIPMTSEAGALKVKPGIDRNIAVSMVKMVQATIHEKEVGPLSTGILLETALPEHEWEVYKGKRRGTLKVLFTGKITTALHDFVMVYQMNYFGTAEKCYEAVLKKQMNNDLNALKQAYPGIDPKNKQMVCASYLANIWVPGDYILIEWPFHRNYYAGAPSGGGFKKAGYLADPMYMLKIVSGFVMQAN